MNNKRMTSSQNQNFSDDSHFAYRHAYARQQLVSLYSQNGNSPPVISAIYIMIPFLLCEPIRTPFQFLLNSVHQATDSDHQTKTSALTNVHHFPSTTRDTNGDTTRGTSRDSSRDNRVTSRATISVTNKDTNDTTSVTTRETETNRPNKSNKTTNYIPPMPTTPPINTTNQPSSPPYILLLTLLPPSNPST
ncbi:hypothetical protein BO94DRAFT_543636 [Aspergillus sclerotioniger CBS 115572]|uniref:Uncharacterized protein n=1 Tax=Aspergillus sclerotioniger CBS 115572 TaxID=1450535 RepID=A0A317X796_9EURO|nr:hypothetical protein BO94DRAFT_543636 [Aspergillus sclerotioniger CBS 115572]PWY93417.1 hypothetical protein BO94DRAFT_543636 [Aspergillus sclerotioniger CBS 115572]